ncbi:CD209 antigen-like protein E [Megalops cyprinoides]|uniref:CD209 antigen-like protein E n=1 Tax=Megalops cyprinoides TaxID=118141 RepID=UPI0018655FA7|nr:CD209 antigen-like protein E [Megalops cyprinoides]
MYSTIGQISHKSLRAQDTVKPVFSEKARKGSHPYRVVAVSLGFLCALFLAAVIGLCVHYVSVSENGSLSQNCSVMDFQQLTANYSTLTKVKDDLQRDYNLMLQKYPFLDQYCTFVSQKSMCRPCPQRWKQFASKCYYFSTETHNWMDSRSSCLKQGADLVIIESEEEQEFINKHTGEGLYWIGLNDSETEGTWLWVDGSPLQKGFWQSGEPNNSYRPDRSDPADCVVNVRHEKVWADTSCHLFWMWICETEALLLTHADMHGLTSD